MEGSKNLPLVRIALTPHGGADMTFSCRRLQEYDFILFKAMSTITVLKSTMVIAALSKGVTNRGVAR